MPRCTVVTVALLVLAAAASAQEPTRVTVDDIEAAFEAVMEAELAVTEAEVGFATDRQSDLLADSAVAFGTAGPFRVIARRGRLEEAQLAVETAWATFAPYVSDPEALFFETAILLPSRLKETVAGPPLVPE